jgi:hypothetical protein
MQLTAPQPRRHKVLMSFRYWNAWDVIFFDTDRMRTALPRRARHPHFKWNDAEGGNVWRHPSGRAVP